MLSPHSEWGVLTVHFLWRLPEAYARMDEAPKRVGSAAWRKRQCGVPFFGWCLVCSFFRGKPQDIANDLKGRRAPSERWAVSSGVPLDRAGLGSARPDRLRFRGSGLVHGKRSKGKAGVGFSLRKVLPLKDRQRTKVQGRVGKSCIKRHRERETFQGTQNSASGALGPEQGFCSHVFSSFVPSFFFSFFFSSLFFSIFFFFFFLLSFLFLLFREASYRRQTSWR